MNWGKIIREIPIARKVNSVGMILATAALMSSVRNRAGAVPAKVKKPKYRAGRNDPCPCQSGVKFKRCCMRKLVA